MGQAILTTSAAPGLFRHVPLDHQGHQGLRGETGNVPSG